MADDKANEKTIAEDLVVTKYKLAGEIVNSEYELQLVFLPVKVKEKSVGHAATFFFGILMMRLFHMKPHSSYLEFRLS